MSDELIPICYTLASMHSVTAWNTRVEFWRMLSPFYKGERWAVRRGRECLSVDGEWEYEPQPSDRDDAFYARCRFPTLEAAVAAYRKML